MKKYTLKKPNNELVAKYLIKFKNNKRYYLADMAIINLFKKFPSNNKLEDILLKISVINDLYSTNIFAVYKLAVHIQKKHIDKYLFNADTKAINLISSGHKIINKNGKEINFYSFASKYCNWHNKEDYPIYDRFVSKVLIAYRNNDKFSNFFNNDLKDYNKFKKVLSDFKQEYNISRYSFKEIDKYLWLYGKELFLKNGY